MMHSSLNEPLVREAIMALLKFEKNKQQTSSKNVLIDNFAKPILAHVR
jgi:hypothetical protein